MIVKRTGRIPKVFPQARITKAIKEELLEVMEQAAKGFVHGISERTPRFSGQARGSVWPLANTVKTNLRRSKIRSKMMDEGRKVPRGQSVASGRPQQEHTVIWNEFYWESYVKYYGRHNTDEGWDALENGETLMLEYFENAILKADLPDKIIGSYII